MTAPLGKIIFIVLSSAMSLQPSHAEGELKDPRTRDEDISATVVTSQARSLGNGFYEYVYSIASPPENKGEILAIDIDLSCDLTFSANPFPEAPSPHFSGNHSPDGKHVPVQPYSVRGFTAYMGITRSNTVTWLVNMQPGETAHGFRMISTAPPGPRAYVLDPSMSTDDYDYDSFDSEDPTVPWKEDFRVYGTVIGPACSQGQEPAWVRSLFAPSPGSSEMVKLPLRSERNIFKLEVGTSKREGSRNAYQVPHSFTDKDVFEIRARR